MRTPGLSGTPAVACALLLAALLAVSPAYAADIVGTPGPDVLVGTDGDDLIDGAGGPDQLSGLAGRDKLYGGEGDDVLDGGDGPDWLVGGPGAGVLQGGEGNDGMQLRGGDVGWGGPGKDWVVPRPGSFVSHGGTGDDYADLNREESRWTVGPITGRHDLYGDGGDDVIQLGTAGSVTSRAFGGAGADQVLASPKDYQSITPVALLYGGSGADSLYGFARRFNGGEGDDSIRTAEFGQAIVSDVSCGDGEDVLWMDRQLNGPLDTFGPDCEHVTVEMFFPTGGRGGLVDGTKYDDVIRTGDGEDTVRALAGDDRVETDWGSDVVDLGAGDDYYENWSTHALGDVDRVTCGPGYDEVYVYRSDVVAGDCEQVEYRN